MFENPKTNYVYLVSTFDSRLRDEDPGVHGNPKIFNIMYMNVLIPHIEAPVTHNRNDDFKLAQCHVCIDKLYNRHLGCLGKPGVLNCGIPVVTCIVYVTGIKFVYGCIWYMKILSTDVCACMCIYVQVCWQPKFL